MPILISQIRLYDLVVRFVTTAFHSLIAPTCAYVKKVPLIRMSGETSVRILHSNMQPSTNNRNNSIAAY